MLQYLLDANTEYGDNSMGSAVPFTGMMYINNLIHIDADNIISIGSIEGDASGTSLCVVNYRTRNVIIVRMPSSLVEVIGDKSCLRRGDVRRKFMISIQHCSHC